MNKVCRILLIAVLLLAGATRARAYDIYSAMISVNNNLSNGYVEVDLPFYDDDGLDEALAADRESGVWVNDTKVVTFWALDKKNHAQSDGNSYWCGLYANTNQNNIEVELQNGSTQRVDGDVELTFAKRSSTTAYVKVRIYPRVEMLKSGSIKVNVKLHVDKINSDFYDVESTRYLTYSLPTLPSPVFSLSADTPGHQTMNFTGKSAGDIYRIYDAAGNLQSQGTVETDNQTLTYDFPIDNNPRPVVITNMVRISKYQILDIDTRGTIPAYFMPSTFTAEQNSNCNVKLQWIVDADTYDRNYQNTDGNWKVQRADNPQFTNPVDICTMEIGTKLTYDKTYTFTDPTSAGNLNGVYYYRIGRSGNQWGWNEGAYHACSINLEMNHRYIAAAEATVMDGVVTVSWDWDNGSVWSDGSAVYYVRTNTTTGLTASPVALSSSQIAARSFEDRLPSQREYYSYKIYVVPGNNKYDSQAPLDVHSDVDLVDLEMGHVKTLTASKGYYNDCVDLRWTTDGHAVEFFSVLARVNGSGREFEQIASIEANNASTNYLYSDTRAVPGLIYDYLVRCNVKCNNEPVSEPGKSDIGFRRPTGEINGRVAYSTGQAEEGVVVTAEPAEESDFCGTALNLDVEGKLTVAGDRLLSGADEFTFQAWINPSSTSGTIAEKPGLFTLSIVDNKLCLTVGDQTLVTTETVDHLADAQTNFLHVSAVAAPDSLFIYVNGVLQASVDRIVANLTPSGALVMGEGLSGIIDEVRVWNIPLSAAVIARDYNRYIVGNESGLQAYYTFDLCTSDAFFDLSYHGLDYNENHGTFEGAAAETESVPGDRQLGYRGITGVDGTYAIRSIPFSGNGMSYLIVPQMGNHSFSPVKELRYISTSSTVHTVNFTDNSSFLVSGYVTYEGGTVPVEGVEFTVDGVTCTSKGQTILTDSKGYFEIQVPVGTHEVRAVKDGHLFENQGRITNSDGTDRNYQDILTGVAISDLTLIKYVGRLSGGARQAELPVGFDLSTNNLGNATSVKLRYQNDAYCLIDTERTEVEGNYREGNPAAAVVENTVHYRDNEIVIYPNETTGEFVAFVPPLKYAITVNAPGYENSVRQLGQEKDFSSYVEYKTETYSYTDSVVEGGVKVPVTREEILWYNLRQNFSVRVSPEIEVRQYLGSALKYFGEKETEIADDADGDPVTLHLYDEETDSYTLGRPVFVRGVGYQLRAAVHEVYRYRDALGDEVSGHDADKVPSKNATVEFICGKDSPVKVQADSLGMAYHRFSIPSPDLNNPVATVSVKAKVDDDGTYFDWKDNALLKDFIVTGSKRKGSGFITAGPDQLLTVLRDPPGSNSYAFIEEGTSLSRKTTVQNYATVSSEQGVSKKMGEKTVLAGVVTDIKLDNGGVVSEQTKHGGTNLWTAKYTFTQGFQTSADPVWVGAPADLYIGHSTNLSYGECDIVMLISAKNYADVSAQYSDMFKTYDAITPEGSPYRLVARTGIDSQIEYGTTFAYTQHYIENTLIPNLLKVRNSLLHQPAEFTDQQALDEANRIKEPVYVSKVAPDDDEFGKSDPILLAQTDRMSEYKNYRIYYPDKSAVNQRVVYSDSVMSLNESVRLWQERIADNERAKLEAKHVDNYSFQGGGSRVSVSESYSYTHTYGYVWSAGLTYTHHYVNENLIGGKGFGITVKAKVDDYNGGERSNGVDKTAKKGFVLADNNVSDYFSVDVLREQNDDMPIEEEGDAEMEMPNEGYRPAFVFRTKGGASSCPYEGQRVTKYYNPGTELDAATIQIEAPQIVIENPFVENVPSGEAAAIVLKLGNNSDADCTMKFKLKEVEKTNPDGLQMTIDGSSFNSGYTIAIPAGQIITKTLMCHKGSVLNYDDIGLKLASDYVGLGVQPEIEAKAYFTVHFTPGASAVNIAKPAASWTYNTNLPTQTIGGVKKHYMEIELDGFDTGYENFNCIRLQYKPTSASDEEWITLHSYFADETLYDEALRDHKEASLITAADRGKLYYRWFMDDMMDQNYDLRAIGVSNINNVEYTNASAVRSGIKDMYNPRLFGQPQPADGVLGVEDEVRLNFNEPIAEGYLTQNNFSVTGVRNGAATDHSVSVEIQNGGQALTSPFTRNLAGKDLTVEMWVKSPAQGAATWFACGDLGFGITADSRLTVTSGDWSATGSAAVDFKPGEWAHVALVYDKEGNVDAYYNFTSGLTAAGAPELPSEGKYAFGADFNGNLHDARIWTRPVRLVDLKANSLAQLSGREKGLMAYYPMDEGRGIQLTDRAHGANIDMTGAQWTLPAGKAVALDGASCVKIDTGAAVIDSSMDFTAELWFKGSEANADATLLANGTGEGRDEMCLGFEGGVLRYVNNGVVHEATGDWLDNAWHHVAVAVSRTNGRGQICVDGKLNSYFSAEEVGGFGGAFAAIGARVSHEDALNYSLDSYFTGSVDDVRLWNVYRNEDILANGCNAQLAGDEMGLIGYYPFESYIEYMGVPELVFSLADARTVAEGASAAADAELVGTTTAAAATASCAPVKGSGEVSKLLYDFVVNNDAIIITLNEDPARIENTIVTFAVDGVRDLNGNKILSPITWTAYVDRNQLRWSDDHIDLTLEEGESATFSADVVNSSGRNINYTLTGLPGWLEASATSGKIGPASRETVTFIVSDAAAIGDYTEYIYLTGDNDVNSALVLNLKISGRKPDWSVNPADFDYTMNVFGRLKIGETFSADTDDLVGVFSGGKCVGLANNAYVKQNDSYAVLLTVYGKTSSSQSNLEFYAWDASTGRTLVLTPDRDIAFTKDVVVGTIDNPVLLHARGDLVQAVSLESGWSWISVAVEDPKLTDINRALGGYDWSANDIVKSEAQALVGYHMNGLWTGSLAGLSTDMMYLVYSEQPKTLRFGGPLVTGRQITVLGAAGDTPRWTYLPYWGVTKLTVDEAMAGYEATVGDILKSQARFAVYSATLGWVGNLTAMEPGRGYMLRRSGTDDASLTYAAGSLGAQRLPVVASDAADASTYAANMTVVTRLKGVDVAPGDRLVAYVGGEERGSAVVADVDGAGELFFLTVSGDEADVVDVVLEHGDKHVASRANVVDYRANASHGTAENPFVIDFERTCGVRVYPTVVSDVVNIDVTADGARMVTADVIDLAALRLVSHPMDLADGCGTSQIDVSTLSPGIYFVVVDCGGERQTFKIIKK